MHRIFVRQRVFVRLSLFGNSVSATNEGKPWSLYRFPPQSVWKFSECDEMLQAAPRGSGIRLSLFGNSVSATGG